MADPSSQPHSFFKRQIDFSRISLGVLPIAFLYMLVISWRKWSDLIVDYGQQLYVPWQLAEGQVLYRDIIYIYGPFSSYLHALVFKLFGPGMLTLALFNILLLLCLTGIIYLILKTISDKLTAMVGALTFITVFAFGQYALGGNYNFICAYVYELPHGIFLSFLAIHQFTKYARNPEPHRLAILGFLCGLIYLTKPEVFLASFTAIVVGLGMVHRWVDPARPIKNMFAFLTFFLIPSMGFLAYFSYHTSVSTGLEFMISPWAHVMNAELHSAPLYRWVMGLRDFGNNLTQAGIYFSLIAGFLILIFLADRIFKPFIESHPLSHWLFGLLMLGSILLLSDKIDLLSLGRPLPLILFLYLGYLSYKIFIEEKTRTLSPEILIDTVFTIFSFILLFKIFFNVHVHHYGFALAMPATLIAIKLFLYDFPKCAQHFGGSHPFSRTLSLVLVLIFLGGHLKFSTNIYRLKGFSVGTQQDLIIDYFPFLISRGPIVNDTLNYIDRNFEKDIEFATLPDSIIVNYLSRRKSPTEHINLNPGMWMLVGGNEPVIKSLQRSVPPYILLVDREFPEFGLKYFGRDFGKEILDWVSQNYALEKQFGETPFTGKGFGIQILKKREVTGKMDPENPS